MEQKNFPKKIVEKHKQHNPQTLLEATTKFFSANVPWIERDLTWENNNRGQFRLMESPLQFLIRNKLILDPNGEPFHWDVAYNAGHTRELYKDKTFPDPRHGEFVLPRRDHGSPECEIRKFDESDLIPCITSAYLNTKKSIVRNTIDEKELESVLKEQLGEYMGGHPYAYFTCKLDYPERKWRYGLFMALFYHGYSDKTKKIAFEIFDAMNYSMGGKGEFNPTKIDITDHRIDQSFLDEEIFQKVVMRHAMHSNVFFMALLQYARLRGVVSTSMFGWVKAFDRTLWYALSQTGRKVCCAEAAGVWSQYHAEKALGHSIGTPFMDIAVEGFKDEMIVEGWLPTN